MDAYREYQVAEESSAKKPTLAAVWKAMAEHYVDTDNRELIPRTAAACLAAGLDVRRARDVWRYDVAPAVAANLWTSGEWIGFDDEWLLSRIEELRARWDNELPWRWITYWTSASIKEPTWRAIAGVMRFLSSEADAVRRQQLTEDLSQLARVYFAHHRSELDRARSESATSLMRLAPLYHRHFRALMAPVVVAEKAEHAHRCVLYVLGEGASPFDADSAAGASG